MDYAATTLMDKRVVDAMSPWWGDFVGNASSLQNAHGQMAKRARVTWRIKTCLFWSLMATSISI